jgi:hypothetical protein
MRIWQREQRKKGKGRSATGAATATDLDPIVMLVVRLLAAAAVTNDRIAFTNRTPAYDVFVAVFCPVDFKLLRRGGNWDKEDRASQGFRL